MERLYDHIRMLDAEEYPRAFVDIGAYRVEFQSAKISGEKKYIEARVRMYER